jgi:hypothetical protein
VETLELTQETLDLMAAVCNLAEMTADCQIDEDAREEARTLIEELGRRVGLPMTRLELEETELEDGSLSVIIRNHEIAHDVRPKLTVITNDNMDNHD